MECPKCKHNWLPRIPKPVLCPICKYPLNKPPKKPKPIKPTPIIIDKPQKEKEFSYKEPTEAEIKESIKEIHEKGEIISFD